MSPTQIIIRIIANILFFLKKEEIKNAHFKFLVFTGTSGKTTMKDTVYATLHGLGIPASKSIHGYNNELGIILTILDMQDFSIKNLKDWLRVLNKKGIEDRFICIELGADFYQDTKWFLDKFSPYGVFISSSDSYSWSRDIAKVERDRKKLFLSTASEGFIAYHYDDSSIKKLIQESGSKAKLLPFSLKNSTNTLVFLEFWKNPFMSHAVNEAVQVSDELIVTIQNVPYTIVLSKAIFEPQVYGILASYACVHHIAVERLKKVSEVITRYQFSENRLQVYVAKNGAVIIEDSYKATPLCTSWYLNLASKLIATRKVLVMTEMRPLTCNIQSHYKKIAKLALFADIVFFLGPHEFFTIVKNNNKKTKEVGVDEYKMLSKELLNNTSIGDVILLKGSYRYSLSKLRSLLI